MAKHEKKVLKIKDKDKKEISGPINDGMNTPVPDTTSTHIVLESEAALFKQAESPLGNPHKV
jgi:hypothetical protein